MTDANVLGFIGLGVMGESMCRNLAKKSGARVVAYDARSQPLDALAADGVERAASIADVATRAGTIFLCLPGEPQVRAVCFVLRNHGLRSLLPDRHPTEGAFPTTYIIKDLSYAMALAESAGLTLEQASTTRRLMERTAAAGYGEQYYTSVIRTIEKR
jgi:3-hydroxyisobutyrate dehydrogenase-like beta-hydroxyacid dehydrogenase